MISRAQYLRGQKIWDGCAQAYESAIVQGHPDVAAYERFEEDLLDRLLAYLIRDRRRSVQLFDVGCGSGRLHLRYGLKTFLPGTNLPESRDLQSRQAPVLSRRDPILAAGLKRVGGLDFSQEMLALARSKIEQAGLASLLGGFLRFEQGSAFDLEPLSAEAMPIAVALCNSVGVMQGKEGAQLLFQSMRRAVEEAGGIAIISAYRQDMAADFALSNYESTLDVSGQPLWLTPTAYASSDYRLQAQAFTRAYGAESALKVDVYDSNGRLVEKDFELRRDAEAVAEMLASGHVRTHWDYESFWFSMAQVDAWMREFWPAGRYRHIAGIDMDRLRAASVQLAVFDPQDQLTPFFDRLGLYRETLSRDVREP